MSYVNDLANRHRHGRGWLIAFSLALTFRGASASALSPQIEPNPEIQADIAVVAAAKNEDQLQSALAKLRKHSGDDPTILIPQLVYVSLHAKDEQTGMVAGIIVQRLGIMRAQLRQVLEPYRSTDDPKLKRQIDNFLGEEALQATPVGNTDK